MAIASENLASTTRPNRSSIVGFSRYAPDQVISAFAVSSRKQTIFSWNNGCTSTTKMTSKLIAQTDDRIRAPPLTSSIFYYTVGP
jgi:hypothetical protein